MQEQEKTSDLVLSAPVRGRFGELLAPRVNHGEVRFIVAGAVVQEGTLSNKICTVGNSQAWPPVQKVGGWGLARIGDGEYHKVVLIEASFPRRPSAPADPRRRQTDPIKRKIDTELRIKGFILE